MTVSMETMQVSVQEAKKQLAGYIDERLLRYEERQTMRRQRGIKVAAFLGHGRAGKDEAARLFGQCTAAVYGASTSWVMSPLIGYSLGVPKDTAWENRHKDRMYWKAWCDEFRRDDQTIISRMLLADSDLIVGTRGKPEFYDTMQDGIADYAVWVNREGNETDPTMDFGLNDLKSFSGRWFELENNGTLADLQMQVEVLAQRLEMLLR